MLNLAVLILAAGQSTRFKSKKTKVLHSLAGRSVLSHVLSTAKSLGAEKVVVVRGNGPDDLKSFLEENGVSSVVQREAFGTANAVQAAEVILSSFNGHVLILCGDAPLVREKTLIDLTNIVKQKGAILSVVTTLMDDPTGYGRIVRDSNGDFLRIVEERDATDEERKIKEINTGVICADCKWLFSKLKNVKSENAKKEFYLTDLVDIAVGEKAKVLAFESNPSEDFIGINTRVDFADVSSAMKIRINKAHMLGGVGILDYLHTTIDADVKIGEDTTVMPYSFLLGTTSIGKNCVIENGVVLKNVVVGDGVQIKAHSVLEESVIEEGAVVGPFARIRPSSKIGKGAKVGNFVELKKCEMKEGAKASHLTYLGDAVIGAKSNVGCGTITCNYDGFAKYQTIIGDEVFVGSDVQFIAPVEIGRGSIIGAGSTITKNVPADALALSRAEQTTIDGGAVKFREKMKKGKK